MANTKIPVELSSTPGIVDGSNATAITIDSSENVGIGTSPTLGAFHVKSAVSDMVTFEQTDAGTVGSKLQLYHNSSSPADGDIISLLTFQGNDDAGNHTSFAGIRGLAADVSNGSEDGTLTFSTTRAGSFTEAMRIDSSGQIGVGTTSPSSYYATNVVVSAGAEGGITIAAAATSYFNYLMFADGTSGSERYKGYIGYAHSTDSFYLVTSDNVRIYTGSSQTEKIRIDSSGNLGIGTTSPSMKVNISHGDQDGLRFNCVNTAETFIDFGDTDDNDVGRISYDHADNHMAFRTNAAERVRIDSSGNLLIGTTTTRTGTQSLSLEQANSYIMFRQTGSSAVAQIQFFRNTDSTATFSGGIISTGTSVSYETTSDYRLKENVNYNFDALTRVKELKPARFNFIVDADKTVDGFLAHEVSDIVPEAITGEKDAVDDEGNPEYQGIDQSKLVPLLTKQSKNNKN